MKRKRLSGRNNILGMSGKLYQKNLDDGSATRFNLQSDVDGAAEDGGRTSPVPRSGCSRHAVCTVCTSVSHAYTKLIQISTRHRDHRPCQGSSRPILSRVPVTTNSGAAPQWFPSCWVVSQEVVVDGLFPWWGGGKTRCPVVFHDKLPFRVESRCDGYTKKSSQGLE